MNSCSSRGRLGQGRPCGAERVTTSPGVWGAAEGKRTWGDPGQLVRKLLQWFRLGDPWKDLREGLQTLPLTRRRGDVGEARVACTDFGVLCIFLFVVTFLLPIPLSKLIAFFSPTSSFLFTCWHLSFYYIFFL